MSIQAHGFPASLHYFDFLCRAGDDQGELYLDTLSDVDDVARFRQDLPVVIRDITQRLMESLPSQLGPVEVVCEVGDCHLELLAVRPDRTAALYVTAPLPPDGHQLYLVVDRADQPPPRQDHESERHQTAPMALSSCPFPVAIHARGTELDTSMCQLYGFSTVLMPERPEPRHFN